MVFAREEYIKVIIDKLTEVERKLELINSLGLYDANLMAESFYCGLLNILFDWNLINANRIRKNYPGIDLIDEAEGVVVQVSSTTSAAKIQLSIENFLKSYEGERKYHFYMMCLSQKKSYTKEFDTKGRLVFDRNNDIFDTKVLVEKMSGDNIAIEKLEKIYTYLEKNLGGISRGCDEPKRIYLDRDFENYMNQEIDAYKERDIAVKTVHLLYMALKFPGNPAVDIIRAYDPDFMNSLSNLVAKLDQYNFSKGNKFDEIQRNEFQRLVNVGIENNKNDLNITGVVTPCQFCYFLFEYSAYTEHSTVYKIKEHFGNTFMEMVTALKRQMLPTLISTQIDF